MNLEHLRKIDSKNSLLEYDEYFVDPVRKIVESLVSVIYNLQDRLDNLEKKFSIENYKPSLEETYYTEQESGVDYNNE